MHFLNVKILIWRNYNLFFFPHYLQFLRCNRDLHISILVESSDFSMQNAVRSIHAAFRPKSGWRAHGYCASCFENLKKNKKTPLFFVSLRVSNFCRIATNTTVTLQILPALRQTRASIAFAVKITPLSVYKKVHQS